MTQFEIVSWVSTVSGLCFLVGGILCGLYYQWKEEKALVKVNSVRPSTDEFLRIHGLSAILVKNGKYTRVGLKPYSGYTYVGTRLLPPNNNSIHVGFCALEFLRLIRAFRDEKIGYKEFITPFNDAQKKSNRKLTDQEGF